MIGMERGDSIVHVIAIAIAAAFGAGLSTWAINHYVARPSLAVDDQSCNTLGILVHGTIVGTRADVPISDVFQIQDASGGTTLQYPNYTIAEDIEDRVRYYKDDPSIKAILLDVDSGGGAQVGSEDIVVALRQLQKPTVAVIHDMGASGGYLVASAADLVFANDDSLVGSIGVTSSFVSQYEKDKKEGYRYEALSSAPYKDMLNPDKPLTDAERAIIMRDLAINHEHFVAIVAANRGLPAEKVSALADGSAMLGEQALDNGLVDKLGSTWDAIEYLRDKIGEEPVICWQ